MAKPQDAEPATHPTRPGRRRRRPASASAVLRLLRTVYPEPRCELSYETPLDLLVATILSAQCTDRRVNEVTQGLFRKYRQPADYLAVTQEELEADIHSTGFFRNKAKNIRGACARLLEAFDGQVPGTMAELLTLPGVARKTANVVLGEAFGHAEGIAVDTHVTRLSGLLGLTSHRDPVKIERDLMAAFPRTEWIAISHLLILHGRRVCIARRPNCGACVLAEICPAAHVGGQGKQGGQDVRGPREGSVADGRGGQDARGPREGSVAERRSGQDARGPRG